LIKLSKQICLKQKSQHLQKGADTLTYRKRLALLIILDSLIVSFAIFAATRLVYPNIDSYSNTILLITALALLAFHLLCAFIYKLYNKVWAYASVGELFAIVKAVTLSLISAAIVQFIINDFTRYRRALIITWLLHIILTGGSRLAWRVVRDRYIVSNKGKMRTLIVGAGSAGTMIARQLKNNHDDAELLPVAFVDDDISKQRMEMYGVPVLGQIKDIPD